MPISAHRRSLIARRSASRSPSTTRTRSRPAGPAELPAAPTAAHPLPPAERGGQIHGQDMRGNANVVNGMVQLANMFGYVSNLRSMSQGRATFTMQFDHYEQVPQAVAAEIQAKFA